MAGRTLVLIRHARVAVDPARPVERWNLTAEGQEAARGLSRHPAVAEVHAFFTSPELKAVTTARAVAAGRQVDEIEMLRELDRSAAGWVGDDAAYAAMVEEILLHPTRSVRGCETAVEGQRRVTLAVEGLLAAYPDGTLAIVSGGILLTLLLWSLQDLPEPDPAVWRAMRMPDVAVIAPEERRILMPFGGASGAAQTIW